MRAGGILLHIASLPDRVGVGNLGDADKFIGFLKKSGMKYWQVLPCGPTDAVHSPYSSPSAFAGNPLFINLYKLVDEGYLTDEDMPKEKKHGMDYAFAEEVYDRLLRKASAKFFSDNPTQEYQHFCEDNGFWLDDYALFCALKKHFGGKSWQYWEQNVRMRQPAALAEYAEQLTEETDFVKFTQYVFFSQWQLFRNSLQKAGIKLIGDVPMYVNYDSADVWAHPQFFQLTAERYPAFVAGVPPDYFSADGQLWGNPLYDWAAMKKDGYTWWLDRIGQCAVLYDAVRIDHFRAFDSYYSIKAGEKTARHGSWKSGVGLPFLKLLSEKYPSLQLLAEDLGDVPPSVGKLCRDANVPGMKVMQFAFDGNPNNPFLPRNYPYFCVAYLGTHDNDTTAGWWQSLDGRQKKIVMNGLGVETMDDPVRTLMEKLAYSPAETVVFTMQDVDCCGSECRMNVPGQTEGCWSYMAEDGAFSNANAKYLAKLMTKSNRTGG